MGDSTWFGRFFEYHNAGALVGQCVQAPGALRQELVGVLVAKGFVDVVKVQ